MAHKWIIDNDKFKLGNVTLHEEFIGGNIKNPEKRKLVKGGGFFKFNEDKTELKLFGRSFDFGSCCEEDFKEIKYPHSLKEISIYLIYDSTGESIKIK